MDARIQKAFVEELRKIGEGFVPSNSTVSTPINYSPENDRWKDMTAGEIEKEKRRLKYASIVKRGWRPKKDK
jgi:hypothetical protein